MQFLLYRHFSDIQERIYLATCELMGISNRLLACLKKNQLIYGLSFGWLFSHLNGLAWSLRPQEHHTYKQDRQLLSLDQQIYAWPKFDHEYQIFFRPNRLYLLALGLVGQPKGYLFRRLEGWSLFFA